MWLHVTGWRLHSASRTHEPWWSTKPDGQAQPALQAMHSCWRSQVAGQTLAHGVQIMPPVHVSGSISAACTLLSLATAPCFGLHGCATTQSGGAWTSMLAPCQYSSTSVPVDSWKQVWNRWAGPSRSDTTRLSQ